MNKKKDKRDDFLDLVPRGTRRLLDVGCGSGGLSMRLKEKGIEAVGVEKNENLCSLAKEKLDTVISGDVENLKLDYPEGYFDCIMYADILEHLTEPLNILEKHKIYLQKDGCVIASIPNVRYYKIILRLILSGAWDYNDAGMLDRTHVRFFGLINIIELFEKAGYEIVEIRRNVIAARGFRVLNFIFFNNLKDFLTYQYYIKAKKSDNLLKTCTDARKIYKF
ncbi:MAG TPA: class I SAM-dependent methyltransferase [Candidatus Omnitrophica bacterium]|nr:class I SAM-dependent methyltransferase [Candidatus Omnitrophota bacterium]